MKIDKLEKLSPRTNKKIYDFDIMSAEQVNDACIKAKNAFEIWKNTSLKDRKAFLSNLIDIIRDSSDCIIETIIKDIEKPFCQAETEVIESCDILEYYCTEIFDGIDSPIEIPLNSKLWEHKKSYGLYQPNGVYAVIKPWNYPFELTLWAIAPLLIAGNTIVYKPSELSTATGILLAKLINKAGFPDGVFNIILGDGNTGRILIQNENINGISFTGSSKVGKEIYEKAKNAGTKFSIEMGGSDFAIVLNDEIDEITIPGILWGAFSNAGQVCVSVEKLLVAEDIYENFIKKIVSETRKLLIKKEISPVVSKKHYVHAQEIIDKALKNGGKILCGGIDRENDKLSNGNYICPTIIECKNYEFLSNLDEIFAPIMLVAPFKTEKEVINIINSSPYGLGCSIWTGNHKKYKELYKMLDVGMIWINEVNLPMPQVPWIGIKKSGIGLNLSKNAVYDSMNLKVIHVDNDTVKRTWWYPYN